MKKSAWKIVLLVFLSLALLLSCDPVDDNPKPQVKVTYSAGSGSGKDIVFIEDDGNHTLIPNSEIEVAVTTTANSSSSNRTFAGYTKKDFSFYGWRDQNGNLYQYSLNASKNNYKFTKDIVLTALWRNDLTGELITGDQYYKITDYTGNGSTELIIPRVYTDWSDPDTPKDYFVSTIDSNAISDTDLKTVVLPDTITAIKENAFTNCKNLQTVDIQSTSVPTMTDKAFPAAAKIVVPGEVLEDYINTFQSFSEKIQQKTEEIVIKQISAQSVSVKETALTIELGQTAYIHYSIVPSNATNQKVLFVSSNPAVASVDLNNGKVTAVSSGTATITVATQDGNKTASCEVTVPGGQTISNYLTFSSDNPFSLSCAENMCYAQNLEYSTDASTWEPFTSLSDVAAVEKDSKYYIYLCGHDMTCLTSFGVGSTNLALSGTDIACSGNIMSLLDCENPDTVTMSDYAFCCLFKDCTAMVSAPSLPSEQLSDYCYRSLFEGCSSLKSAPELPATTLAEGCYYQMFEGCTSLKSAPALPATTLAGGCYASMFNGCTSLKSAPELPATTLAVSCYNSMFKSCKSLISASDLPATELAESCYSQMFENCTSLTDAPLLPATTLATSCYNRMFYKCTSLTTAPELPATTLAEGCYTDMFRDCTSLNSVTVSFTDWGSGPTNSWLDNVASTGTFNCPEDLEYKTGGDFIPETWDATNKPQPNCLIFYSENELTLGFQSLPSSYNGNFEISTDGKNWTTVTDKNVSETGKKVYLRGKGWTSTYVNYVWTQLELTGTNVACSGNIMTLLDYKNPDQVTMTDYAFYYLFKYCSCLTDASNLILPATTLSYGCYKYMFYGCSGLISAPKLPAENLTQDCYWEMFRGCTSLVDAPALPATSLASFCYYMMFGGCTSLESAPDLPATTLAANCYNFMFDDCSKLATAPDLPATVLVSSCYKGMFRGCTSLESAPDLPATTLADSCYYSMFEGCSKLTNAPALTVTTLEGNCYNSMFKNCTSLVNPPALPATQLREGCYASMFEGCSNLTTTPVLSSIDVNSYCYSYMFKNCTSLKETPVLPATTLADNCYANMFEGCSKLTTATELPATQLTENCYASMFEGCTSLTSAPALPATQLVKNCYQNMFNGCSSLNSVAVSFTDWNSGNSTECWLSGVANSGTFNCPEDLFYKTGESRIPKNWNSTNQPLSNCLTFSSENELTLGFAYLNSTKLQVSTDGVNWTTVTDMSVSATGNTVYLRGKDLTSLGHYGQPVLTISGTDVSCYGNIMTLLDYENPDQTTMNFDAFSGLFNGCTCLTDVSNLSFPATTAVNCYASMFAGCTGIVDAPVLPATKLEDSCYASMFDRCISLVNAPALSATQLARSCYSGMFFGCTSLVNAPALPATELAESCYSQMFENCTSLTDAPLLPATSLASFCYYMMFGGCTSLESAPDLPATTLTDFCYREMFTGCSKLERVTVGFIDWGTDTAPYPGEIPTKGWLDGVASSGKFECFETLEYKTGSDFIPAGWNFNNYMQCLAKGTLITMADGSTKNIEDIETGDPVLTFDHESGSYVAKEVYYVYKGEYEDRAFTLHFENGVELSIVGVHDLFEEESIKYVRVSKSDAESFVGKHFYCASENKYLELLSVSYETKKTQYYSIYTYQNFNCIANGMLSVPDYIDHMLNIYEFEKDLKADKQALEDDIAKFGLYNPSSQSLFDYQLFNEQRFYYANIVVGKNLATWDYLKEISFEYFE